MPFRSIILISLANFRTKKLLEMLILTIRGETIKYSSLKKKKEKNNEIKLINEIEELGKKKKHN